MSSSTLPASRLSRIAQARQLAMQEAAPLAGGLVEPWIAQSWQRCLAQGLRPQERVAFEAVSAAVHAPGLGGQPHADAGRAPHPQAARRRPGRHALLRHPHQPRRRGGRRGRPHRPQRPACRRHHPRRGRPVGEQRGHHRHRCGAARTAAGLAAPRRTLLPGHLGLQLRRLAVVRPRRPLRRHAGPHRRRSRGAPGTQPPGHALGAAASKTRCCCSARTACCCA